MKSKQTVRAKKHLGQHFLRDLNIAKRIADSLDLKLCDNIIEIGPGTGVLTQFLLMKPMDLIAFEVDRESVEYLQSHYAKELSTGSERNFQVLHADFLKVDLAKFFQERCFSIIGNFPYNISSQIIFKALEYRQQVKQICGMFQYEVAQRICSDKNSKSYGIISVLVQAFYDAEFLFTVPPNVFKPPPKVDSGVIRLTRKKNQDLGVDEALFTRVVKMSFNQRRKTLRNSLKPMGLPENLREDTIFDRRPEQLGVEEFLDLTRMIANDTI